MAIFKSEDDPVVPRYFQRAKTFQPPFQLMKTRTAVFQILFGGRSIQP